MAADEVIFSIIVPNYNAEKYVVECLKSINNQNFTKYEVIIIDDGSTDSSVELIDCYINGKAKFKLVTKLNGGVSSARNVGLKLAIGEYIVFVDSDDWVEKNYLRSAYEYIIQCGNLDGIIFNYIVADGDKRKVVKKINRTETITSDSLEVMLLDEKISNSPWDKIFHRKLYFDPIEPILFSEGISVGEDALLVFNVLSKAHKIKLVDKCFLNYRYNSSSVTKSEVTEKKVTDILFVAKEIHRYSESKKNIYSYKVKLLIDYYVICCKNKNIHSEELDREIKDSIKKCSLSSFDTISVKIKIIVLKILNFVGWLSIVRFLR